MMKSMWKELRMAMTRQEVAEILQRLLESDLASRRASQGALKPEEKKALKVAIKELRR